MRMRYDADIIYKINNSKYVILNILGIWNIHIDKEKSEIFHLADLSLGCDTNIALCAETV